MSELQHLPTDPYARPRPEPDGVFTLVISSGVTSSGLTLTSTEFEQVLSGGVAIFNTIDSGGQATVMSGGLTEGDAVLSGGTEVLSTGGVASGLVVSANGLVSGTGILDSAAIYGFATSVSVGTDGDFYPATYIEAGGTASALTVLNTAILEVEPSGVAMATTVDGGGILFVDESGLASGATVANGGVLAVNGEADAARIAGGGYVSVSGYVSSSASDPDMTVQAVLSNAELGGGAQLEIDAEGVASAVRVDSGGFIEVQSGGELVNATLVGAALSAGGGSLVGGLVLSGGASATLRTTAEAFGVKVLSGTLNIGPEAIAEALTTSSGGTVVDNGLVGDGAIAGQTGTTVLAGAMTGSGLFVVENGGAVVLSGATSAFTGEFVLGGGKIEFAAAGGASHAKLAFGNTFTSSSQYNVYQIDAADRPVSGGGFAAPLVDFSLASQDRIDLAGLAFTSGATAKVTGNTLTLVDGSYTASFTLSHTKATKYGVKSDDAGGTLIEAGGTAITLIEAAAAFQPTVGGMVLSAAEMRIAGLDLAVGVSGPGARHTFG